MLRTAKRTVTIRCDLCGDALRVADLCHRRVHDVTPAAICPPSGRCHPQGVSASKPAETHRLAPMQTRGPRYGFALG